MKVIKKNKKTVLMEDERGYRFYIPTEIYEDDEADYKKNSIPYSLSFDLVLTELFDAEKITRELYSAGVHTLSDVLDNRKMVNDILKKNISCDKIIHAVTGNHQVSL
ncbi:MAG: hypothetical protein CSB13_01730 [Chloroflexi bacterium]|nr:MAG: hypothetical protein CSB13_01730 [Chloroflexota bacterium]